MSRRNTKQTISTRCSTTPSDFEEAEVVGLGVPSHHGQVGHLDEHLIALPEVEDGPQVTGVLPERLVGPPALGDGVLHQFLLPAVGVDDVVAVQVVGEAGRLRPVCGPAGPSGAGAAGGVEDLEEGDLTVDEVEPVVRDDDTAVAVGDVVGESQVLLVNPHADRELPAWGCGEDEIMVRVLLLLLGIDTH